MLVSHLRYHRHGWQIYGIYESNAPPWMAHYVGSKLALVFGLLSVSLRGHTAK